MSTQPHAMTTTPQAGAVIPMNDSATLLQVIGRAASDPQCDVDKMERLLAMHRDMQARQAEVAFNDALNRVQAHMGRIGTDKTNKQTNSSYATYGKLDRVLRPLYTEEGFALSFGTEDAAPEVVRVLCHVSHRAGHTRRYQIDMPADGKGAKGNDVMTKTHATGSATQYGMRYLLKMIFNVAIGDEDDDGNAAGGYVEPEPEYLDWKAAIAEQTTPEGLKGIKAELEKKFGDRIPKVLVELCVGRMAQIKAKGAQ